MKAIFQGRRHFVVSQTDDGVCLDQLSHSFGPANRIHVLYRDPDLILDPTDEDLDLAEAFERGEINAFEYADGHTYPSNREIHGANQRKPVLDLVWSAESIEED